MNRFPKNTAVDKPLYKNDCLDFLCVTSTIEILIYKSSAALLADHHHMKPIQAKFGEKVF